jgi:hydrogenase maturation protease
MGGIYIKRELSVIEKMRLSRRRKMDCKRSSQGQILILGLGNTILSDDGVGIYVAREIGKQLQSSSVIVKEASVGGLELLDLLVGFRKVVLIDAVLTGRFHVGAVMKMSPEDFRGGSALARHHVGLNEALGLARRLGMNIPDEIVIYGIEVKDILTFSESCTPEVSANIARVAEEIIDREFGCGFHKHFSGAV